MSADKLKADPGEIRRAIELLCEAGAVYELRALTKRQGTVSGYYNNLEALVRDAARVSNELDAGVIGVYFTINPVSRDLLARAMNRFEGYAKHTTADVDIVRRRWLPFDFDPVRPSGISSTAREHAIALERARQVRDFLKAAGWPPSIVADSGNGAHMLARIDLPNDDATRDVIKRTLEALASRFDDDAVHIDKTTFNAARIWKTFGTIARKGDITPERPHRLSRILEAPESVIVVSRVQLEELAALAPKPKPRNGGSYDAASPRRFNVDSFIEQHLSGRIKHIDPYKGGRRLILANCVFDPSHTGTSAAIIEGTDGSLGYSCLHNGCADKHWRDVRELYEPGYREHRQDTPLQPRKATAIAEQPRGGQPVGLRTVRAYLDEVEARQARKSYWGGIIYGGDTVALLGRAFAGKSTFACAFVRALTRGKSFLGRQCARAKVGYMALERNGTKVARLFEKWGLADEVEFTAAVPPMTGERLAGYLIGEIRRLDLDVLIVDHVQTLLRVEDANSYAAVQLALEPINQAARETGKLIIILHHQPKSPGAEGEINCMGSEAWRAACDVLLEATRSGGRHYIRAETRGESDLPRALVNVDLDTGEAEAIDASETVARDAESLIRAFLATQAKPIDAKTIRRGAKLKTGIVCTVLKNGVSAGTILRTGAGKPRNPYLYQLPPSPTESVSDLNMGKSGNESGSGRGTNLPEQGPDSFPPVSQPLEGKAGNESPNAPFASLPEGVNRFPRSGKRIASGANRETNPPALEDAKSDSKSITTGNAGNARNESEECPHGHPPDRRSECEIDHLAADEGTEI